jgi:uncharacterized membrane protein
MTTLITGLIVFLGVHSISNVAPGWRDRCAAAMGEKAWQGLYAVIALIGLVLVVRGYGIARQTPVIVYVSPGWLRDTAIVLLAPVFPLLLAAYLPGKIRAAVRNNPMLVATKLWAAAHLLANGALADIVLFGSFLAWGAFTRISLKFRTPRPVPTLPASTANDAIALIGGLALYFAFIYGAHLWLIGMPITFA